LGLPFWVCLPGSAVLRLPSVAAAPPGRLRAIRASPRVLGAQVTPSGAPRRRAA